MRYNYNDLYIVERPAHPAPTPPSEIEVSHFTVETNADAFGQSGDLFVLVFSANQPEFKEHLLGVTVQFVTVGDATWEYETGKVMDLSSFMFNAFKANDETIAGEQSIALDGAALDTHFGSLAFGNGDLGLDIIFAPNGGTFSANNSTPLLKVDVWTY